MMYQLYNNEVRLLPDLVLFLITVLFRISLWFYLEKEKISYKKIEQKIPKLFDVDKRN